MTNALAPRVPTMAVSALEDPERLGTLLAASGYFQDTRDAAQAVVKVLAGAELGFGPIASMTGINIIKGRVTLSAFLMGATIRRHPRYDYGVREKSNQRAEIVYLETGRKCAVCKGAGTVDGKRCHECAGSGLFAIGSSEFTLEDAKTARLTGENWQKYPGNMLFWRAMSTGAKFFCPDAFSGAPVYTPDELGAEVDVEGALIDAGTPAPEPMPAPSPPAREDISAMARASAPEPAPPPSVAATPTPERSTADKLAANDTDFRRDNGGAASAPPADAGDRAPSAPAPSDPPAGPVTAEEAAALMEVVQSNGIPENVWRIALVTASVDRLEDLPREDFAGLVARVHDRVSRRAG